MPDTSVRQDAPGYRNPIPFTSRDYQTIRDGLQSFLQTNYPALWSDYFESNLGVALIRLIAYTGDMLSYSLDRVAEEAFITTCTQMRTMLRHAKLLGYKPYFSAAASVTAQVVQPPVSLLTNDLSLAKGERVSVGSLTFEVDRDYLIPAGTSPIQFTLVEGMTVEDPEITATGEEWQSYVTRSYPVIQGSWIVIVDGQEWTEVPLVEMEEPTAQCYSVEMESNAAARIRFGNGIFGSIPQAGSTIQITYRTGGGDAGNVPAGSITSSILGLVGGTPTSLYITNPAAASGGSSREEIERIRFYAPAQVRTVDKAITAEDYATLAASFSDPTYGAMAKAVARLREGTLLLKSTGGGSPDAPITVPAGTTFTLGSYGLYHSKTDMVLNGGNPNLVIDPNTVDVFVWAPTEDVGGPTYTAPSSGLKGALLEYLVARSVVTTLPVIRDGPMLPINLNLGVVLVDRTYSLSTVAASITAEIAAFFTRTDLQPGDAFRISDFYDWIEETDGVLSFVARSQNLDLDVEMPSPVHLMTRGSIAFSVEYPPLPSVTSMQGRY